MRRLPNKSVNLRNQPPSSNFQTLLVNAAALVEAGKDNEAERLLRQALAINPHSPVCNAMLGEVLAALGRHDEAVGLLSVAAEYEPANELTRYNLANSYRSLGRIAEAEQMYRIAIRQSPHFGAAYFNLASLLRESGMNTEAINHLETAAKLLPASGLVKYHLGSSYCDAGRFSEAAQQLGNAARVDPSLLQPVLQTAASLLGQQKQPEALLIFQAVVAAHPGCAEAHSNSAIILHALGRPLDAIPHHSALCCLHPELAECWQNLAITQWAAGNKTEAVSAWREATSRDDCNDSAWFQFGNALRQMGETQGSIAAYKRAIELQPENADAYTNLGIEILSLGCFAEAEQAQREAIRLVPSHDAAHTNLAILLLTRGQMKEGFKHYEHRLAFPKYNSRAYNSQQWQGEPLHGKSLLIWGEQGLGDQIQFSRYLNLLQHADGEIVVQCNRGLGKLFKNWYPHCSFVECDKGEPITGHSWYRQASLMSLPHILSESYNDILDPGIPGVTWDLPPRQVLPLSSSKLNVGIVWAGSPHHFNDANRSMNLRALLPLLQLSTVKCFSFQKGNAALQLKDIAEDYRPFDVGHLLEDWYNTSDCLRQMDLLVSVDTSVVHMAGSIGLPVILMLPQLPDWRWRNQGDTTNWYPGMTLLRAQQNGEWHEVAEAALGMIRELHARKFGQFVEAA